MKELKPFENLKVVELASILAGPAVGMFFAELGATVQKIENPATKGDITRQWKVSEEMASSKISAYYTSVNWGKRIEFWDISTAIGRQNLKSLLIDADILILNFKPSDISKFELEYESLSVQFPKLICGYINGYGEEDSRPAFDLVMQAETGFMSMNGTFESGPLKMPVAIIDLMAAHQLKEGILTALYLREKNQMGSKISVSLFDSAIASLANQASNFLVAKHLPQRMGSLHPNIAPYGETIQCSDGKYCVLAIGTDQQFGRFSEVIEKPALSENPKFATNAQRVNNRLKLFEEFENFFRERSSTVVCEILTKNNIPHGFVNSVKEILASKMAEPLILDGKAVKTAVFKIDRNS